LETILYFPGRNPPFAVYREVDLTLGSYPGKPVDLATLRMAYCSSRVSADPAVGACFKIFSSLFKIDI
jgi:hypothetical protein